VVPELSDDTCDRMRAAFLACGYDADGVLELLGEQANAALGRGEPEPALRASAGGGALGVLVRLFVGGATEEEAAVRAALAPLALDDALAAGLLRPVPDGLRAGLEVVPHGDEQGSWWVVSDLDGPRRNRGGGPGRRQREVPAGSNQGRGVPVTADHVLGVGPASMSLARATARRPVDTLLDLGTGCGVQALYASRHAKRITATDVSARALALASATFRLNQLDVELARGEWFAPVAGRRFDQVVCNPPFVVGPPRVDVVYRDSGLAGDGASELLVRQMPTLLTDGGCGQLLASWLHVRGQDWADRVRSWLPAGVDAWVVQRDVADPALYVGTWLRDAGIDPSSAQGRVKSGAWLDWFAETDVEGVGFGFVTLRRSGAEDAEVVCEDLRHAYDDPLGPETAVWLDRVDWLRAHGSPDALLAQRFEVPPSVVLEEVSSPASPDEDGWTTLVRRLHRTDGPGWQHELDELAVALLAGCRGALPLDDLLILLATAHEAPVDALAAVALPAVRSLVLHGMLVPVQARP
jgi:hypothetical protein